MAILLSKLILANTILIKGNREQSQIDFMQSNVGRRYSNSTPKGYQ